MAILLGLLIYCLAVLCLLRLVGATRRAKRRVEPLKREPTRVRQTTGDHRPVIPATPRKVSAAMRRG